MGTEDSLLIYEIRHTGSGESPQERRNDTQPSGWAHPTSFHFQKLAFWAHVSRHCPGAQDTRALLCHFNDPLGSMVCTNPTATDGQRTVTMNTTVWCTEKKEEKIVPWYLGVPRDPLSLCVAALHRNVFCISTGVG